MITYFNSSYLFVSLVYLRTYRHLGLLHTVLSWIVSREREHYVRISEQHVWCWWLTVLTFGNCVLKSWVIKKPLKLYVRFIRYLQDTFRMAAPESHQTSVQKQTHLLCPFSFQFSLETIYCFRCHRIIIQHIPLRYHSMTEKELSNILHAPTFNQLQWMSTSSFCCINLEHIS